MFTASRIRSWSSLRLASVALAFVATLGCVPVALAVTPQCYDPGGCVQFSPNAPPSNASIDVTFVVTSGVPADATVPSLGVTIVGNVVEITGTYVACNCVYFPEPPVLRLHASLGAIAPGTYAVQLTVSADPTYGASGWVLGPDGWVQGPVTMTAALNVGEAVPVTEGTSAAVEYYWAAEDHYFITADASEINLLDANYFPGWVRTGQSFNVLPPSTVPSSDTSPVCRFYGKPEAGLDSHFYSAFPAECQAVIDRFPNAWLLESSDVFVVYLPAQSDGTCPGGTTPVYRVYDNRPDVNHRYMTSLSIRTKMIEAGWIPEGYGPDAVVMCAP